MPRSDGIVPLNWLGELSPNPTTLFVIRSTSTPSHSAMGTSTDQFSDARPARVSRADSSASQSDTNPPVAAPEAAVLPGHTGLRTVTVTVMVSVTPSASVAVSV